MGSIVAAYVIIILGLDLGFILLCCSVDHLQFPTLSSVVLMVYILVFAFFVCLCVCLFLYVIVFLLETQSHIDANNRKVTLFDWLKVFQ